MAEFLGVVKLGTFYLNGKPLPLPQRPWGSNTYPDALSVRGSGDTPSFSGHMSDWTLGDTNSNEDKKLKWVKIKDGTKTLLICTINILNAVSWDDLNASGYITGKKITIDGKPYLCRVLTGGNNPRNEYNRYLGGEPTNEWDRFICNEDNIIGLVKPTSDDLDPSIDYNDLYRQHNQLWHWWGNFSWCKEMNSIQCILRGYSSAGYFSSSNSYSIQNFYGWRPVLEVLNTPPLISGGNEDLGVKNTSFNISYTINDVENDPVKIEEKIDNNIINTIESIELNKRQCMKIDITKLKIGDHKIEIIATDNKGEKSTKTYNFKVTVKKYKLTLDKNIESISNKQADIIKFIPKINNKELQIKQVGKDKIVYFIDKLNTDTVNLEIEGNYCTLDKLNYVIY